MSHLTPVPSDPEALKAWLAQMGSDRMDAVFAGLRNKEITLPEPPVEVGELRIKVTLTHTKPAVWRRLLVPGDITLDALHDVLQAAMGWSDSHLHRFFAGTDPRSPYFVTELDIEEGDEGTLEDLVRLDQVLREPGDRLRYEYDFGDGWTHDVRLEKVDPLPEDVRPRCVGGARACPPEDVGGTWGYAEVAAWHRAGRPGDGVPENFEDLEHALSWLPIDWDPDAFDCEEVDLQLQALSLSGRLLESLKPGCIGALLDVPPSEMPRISTWLAYAATTALGPEDVDEVTRPWRRLLAVIDGGVDLTSSGYLRPAVVQELCRELDIDPILAGKANRESNVRALAMFRKAAQHVGLLHTSQGMLMPTAAGIRYGANPVGLWRHIAERLPTSRSDIKRNLGWFTLVALAGGVSRDAIFDEVTDLCVAAGWEVGAGRPLERWDVIPSVWPTLCALVGPRWNDSDPWPRWVPAAAADVIFARQQPEPADHADP